MKQVIMTGGRNGVLNEGIEKLEGKPKGVGIIMVSNFNKEEWGRMARDADSRGLELVAKRFGAAGALAVGDELPVSVYDELQREYRVWLLAGFPGKPVKAVSAPVVMAAAPDLLAALQHLVRRIEDNPAVRIACLEYMPQAVEQARAAIAKATQGANQS